MNTTVHNAMIGLFAVTAQYYLPNETLFDLINRQQIVHPNNIVPTLNFRKVTQKIIGSIPKGKRKKVSREVLFSICRKVKENVEKYIK